MMNSNAHDLLAFFNAITVKTTRPDALVRKVEDYGSRNWPSWQQASPRSYELLLQAAIEKTVARPGKAASKISKVTVDDGVKVCVITTKDGSKHEVFRAGTPKKQGGEGVRWYSPTSEKVQIALFCGKFRADQVKLTKTGQRFFQVKRGMVVKAEVR